VKIRKSLAALALFAATASSAGASGIYDEHAVLRGIGNNNVGTCHVTQVYGDSALVRVSVRANLANPMQLFDADGYLIDFTTAAIPSEVFVQWVHTSRVNLSKLFVVTQPLVGLRATDEQFFAAVERTMEQGKVFGTCEFSREVE